MQVRLSNHRHHPRHRHHRRRQYHRRRQCHRRRQYHRHYRRSHLHFSSKTTEYSDSEVCWRNQDFYGIVFKRIGLSFSSIV